MSQDNTTEPAGNVQWNDMQNRHDTTIGAGTPAAEQQLSGQLSLRMSDAIAQSNLARAQHASSQSEVRAQEMEDTPR